MRQAPYCDVQSRLFALLHFSWVVREDTVQIIKTARDNARARMK